MRSPGCWRDTHPDDAVAIAKGITDPGSRRQALRDVAEALTEQNPQAAERIVRDLTAGADEETWKLVLQRVAETVADVHDVFEAARLLDAVEDPKRRSWGLLYVVDLAAPRDPAGAEQVARTISDPTDRAYALRSVIYALGECDLAEAERVAQSIPGSDPEQALAWLVIAMARHDPVEGERRACALRDGYKRSLAFRALAEAVLERDRHWAARLLDEAERAARTISAPGLGPSIELREIAALAARYDVAEAERIIGGIEEPGDRDYAAWEAAKNAAAHDPSGAERLARSVEDAYYRSWALRETAAEAARHHHLAAAERMARSITERPELSAWALTDIAEVLLQTSDEASAP